MTPEWSKIKRKYPDAMYLVNYVDGLTQLNGIIEHAAGHPRPIVSRLCFGTQKTSVALQCRPPLSKRIFASKCDFDGNAIADNERMIFELMLNSPKVCYVPPRIKPLGNFGGDIIAADILFLVPQTQKTSAASTRSFQNFANGEPILD